uniref:Uncharacterized protein n=1 Tax=Siphoviridae sp. ctt5z12 TaxID=2823604 RepID=A0A8S5LBR7_9CAUD|nr:MAG TPA: hypothetical protein [Siphoviridae sp. ctt5z12]
MASNLSSIIFFGVAWILACVTNKKERPRVGDD